MIAVYEDMKGSFSFFLFFWHGNLAQLTTHSLQPTTGDLDLAVSSVIMSESYRVKRAHTVTGNIVCNGWKKKKGRGNIVPLMHFFEKKRK